VCGGACAASSCVTCALPCWQCGQIDCVTVKGSNQPMGLFTYDVTLERVPVPVPRNPVASTLAAAAADLIRAVPHAKSMFGGPGGSPGSRTPHRAASAAAVAAAAATAAAAAAADADFTSYSLSAYEQEFVEHPDLLATWAVDEAFLARFAEGFAAYRCLPCPLQCVPCSQY